MNPPSPRAPRLLTALLAGLITTGAWAQAASAPATAPAPAAAVAPTAPAPAAVTAGDEMAGTAAWYGRKFAGRKTASGERFNPQALTAAHRTLAFGTRVKVTNTKNKRSVVVRINDRLPAGSRIIDVSQAAAQRLGFVKAGLTDVTLEVIAKR